MTFIDPVHHRVSTEDWLFMRRLRIVGGVVASAVLAVLMVVTIAPAASAGPPPKPAGKYCFTEVAPTSPGSRELKEVSTTCSNTAKPGTVLPDTARAAAAMQLLVIFHQTADYGGAYDTVGGNFGPCDAAGYGFSNLTLVNFNVGGISSYELAAGSNCRVADYWTNTGYTGTGRFGYVGNNPYVGAAWNDVLYSMKVRG